MENQIAKKKLVHTMLVRVSSPLSVMSRNSSSLIIFSFLKVFKVEGGEEGEGVEEEEEGKKRVS